MTEEALLVAGERAVVPKSIRDAALRFQKPSLGRAIWQMVNTFGPYAAIWWAMYYTREISWLLTAGLAVLAGGFLVRVFIIFHDCGHGSYFASKTANTIVGFISGLLTFTPYHHWRWEHAVHHATSGNLDARGIGDVWTMTVDEYLAASKWKRLAYRLLRNPLLLFGLGPLFLFLIWHRFPSSKARPRERYALYVMNVAVLLMAAGMSWIFGVRDYLILQVLVMMVAGGAGMWMFYVQHQFEDVYWERDDKWDYATSALLGSSFYKLPRILMWFTGNIGYHHIHHLNSKIPNYNLERCHQACPEFQTVRPLTLLGSLKSLSLRLWDEQQRRMIGFRDLRLIASQRAASRT